MKNTLILFLLLASFPLFSQTRIYVSANAGGANTGVSWADAYTNLQTALQLAQAGDSVWVAEGTYFPTDSTDRAIAFEPKSGVRLYGGFAGTEMDLSERDWVAHPTVLSGDIGVNGDSTDNAYTIMYLENPDTGTVVDGFVFRYGNADNLDNTIPSLGPQKCGGAMYIMGQDGWAYPDVQNCIFEYNYAHNNGGAVYVNGLGLGSVAPRFLNCTFRDNKARLDGGGIYRYGSSWIERFPDFGDCIFVGNHAQRRGGGMYVLDRERTDTINWLNCLFEKNSANLQGGAKYINLGRFEGSLVTIHDCVYDANHARESPMLHLESNNFQNTKLIDIYECEAYDNYSDLYALMHVTTNSTSESNIKLSNSHFYDNKAGRLIYIESSATGAITTISDCTLDCDTFFGIVLNIFGNNPYIYRNIISGIGFLITIHDWSIDTLGAQFIKNHVTGSSVSNVFHVRNAFKCISNFINCGNANLFYVEDPSEIYFYGNTVVCGQLFESITTSDVISIDLKNDIFIRETSASNYLLNYATALNYDLQSIENCYLDVDYCTIPTLSCGSGIQTVIDPLFVDPSNGDFRLQPCSPLRDAGSNNAVPADLLTDLDGRPRILGGTVDMGAYEIPDFAPAADPIATGTCFGTSNGAVTFETEGGCEPFVYLWQPGGGTSTSGLAAGDYTFTVTDADGRSFSDTVTVPELPGPEIRADSIPISCFGEADASLAVAPFTGVEPFTFLWTGGITDSILTPVGAGMWTVTATDALGCSVTYTYHISAPDSLQFAATVQNATGPAEADGSIAISGIMGGTGPYSYLWSPGGGTGNTLSNVAPGLYSVIVTDVRGCQSEWTYEVSFTIGTANPGRGVTFSLYPNPTTDGVWIDLTAASGEAYFFEMYDAQGRRVVQRGAMPGVQRIPLDQLKAGSYVAVVKNEHGLLLATENLVVR
ncbi:MAG: T9SS type A sorting domain-containing protein [Saprospiraceae bacterium]|nr:T9SS type A sorting domain-containing protein [Saprospiraceae bacterium]